MIRVFKHPVAPPSLSKRESWSEEDVIAQLKSDQNGKCYLCERIQYTDFEVEHHSSRTNHPDGRFEWSNLYWACGYCNRKKSASFDNLVNPSEENVEEQIKQFFDFPNAKAVFSCNGSSSESIDATINLLGRIFNGTKRFRTIREQQLYDYAVSKITIFQGLVISWLENPTEETRNAILEELNIKSEFLGFKYWIITSNEKLFETFGAHTKWNK